MKLQTTINILRAAHPCADGYAKLLRSLPTDHDHDAPIDFSHILESNGLDDALWALRAVLPEQEKDLAREARLLACDYAEAALPIFEAQYPEDKRPRECIEVARRFAAGHATPLERDAARDAAWDAWDAARSAARDAARSAARDAARSAAWAARDAAWDAWDAWDAARSAARDAQAEQFKARFCA